jgi:K+-transporting ATPase ATPase B chain
VEGVGGKVPAEATSACERIARSGGTPLAVSVGNRVLGVIHLKDVVKQGIKERFAGLHAMGIRTVMITGDNRLTAAAIAAESGVSDFVAEAKPESKLEAIRAEQRAGHLVGMIGDGTNDAPALAQADVGVAMASGTQTAREAGNMIDFDNDPAKVIDVVEVGKQLLITRGSLTTFSIANDVAKYFAILPAVFSGFYASKAAGPGGLLGTLNIMHLATPESAILSAVIFNAIIIIALIPLALRGVKFNPKAGASRILRRNLLIYGLGGIIAPFIGIKLIDLLLGALGLA